jgi:hypothetical protein
MAKITDGDLEDDDDFLSDIRVDDPGPLPNSDDPDHNAIDPEFDNSRMSEDADDGNLYNPDGTLKNDWEGILEKIERERRAKEVVSATQPSRGEPRQAPSGDLLVFEARPGNYIFAVGLPGSGKTVLQSHVLHYLFESSRYDTGSDPDPKIAPSQLQTLNYWKRCWRTGEFPEATQIDRADHFRYIIRTKEEDRLNSRYKFGFVEVSGEHFLKIEGEMGQQPQLPEAIQKLLADKRCRIVFLLVCNAAKDPRRDDDFFHSFFDYFSYHPQLKFRKDTSIAFVLANPKAAKLVIDRALRDAIDRGRPESERNKKLQEERSLVGRAEISGDRLARLFLRHLMRKTRSSLRSWDGPKRAFGFSIGATRHNAEKQRSEVAEYDFDDADRVFRWVYRQTTRIQLPRVFGMKVFDDSDD